MRNLARPLSSPLLTNGVYDEEDVALSAFTVFCQAAQAGNYPDLEDREGLWRLLATITLRKSRERARSSRALKRGGSQANSSTRNADLETEIDLDQLPDDTPAPDLIVLMSEQCEALLHLLDDPELESLAVWKLEGYTNDEIAVRMGYTRRTVQRMLALIRQIWESNRR